MRVKQRIISPSESQRGYVVKSIRFEMKFWSIHSRDNAANRYLDERARFFFKFITNLNENYFIRFNFASKTYKKFVTSYCLQCQRPVQHVTSTSTANCRLNLGLNCSRPWATETNAVGQFQRSARLVFKQYVDIIRGVYIIG